MNTIRGTTGGSPYMISMLKNGATPCWVAVYLSNRNPQFPLVTGGYSRGRTFGAELNLNDRAHYPVYPYEYHQGNHGGGPPT
jgi:hypothetical protein